MALNLLKKYPELLEILHLGKEARIESLRRVFNRDIQNNQNFRFRSKQLRPILVDGEASMGNLFNHLTREEIIEIDSDGRPLKKRVFEKDRSMRLHWIKHHIEENKKDNMEVFSVRERDLEKRKDIITTYLYDIEQKYVIVLEPQSSGMDYYLKSAYYLNRDYGEKKIRKKLGKRLKEVY